MPTKNICHPLKKSFIYNDGEYKWGSLGVSSIKKNKTHLWQIVNSRFYSEQLHASRTSARKPNAKEKAGISVDHYHSKWGAAVKVLDWIRSWKATAQVWLVSFALTSPLWGTSSNNISICVPLSFLKGLKAQVRKSLRRHKTWPSSPSHFSIFWSF